jgi:hypothetical protein
MHTHIHVVYYRYAPVFFNDCTTPLVYSTLI